MKIKPKDMLDDGDSDKENGTKRSDLEASSKLKQDIIDFYRVSSSVKSSKEYNL
jgi:hypothetical protein